MDKGVLSMKKWCQLGIIALGIVIAIRMIIQLWYGHIFVDGNFLVLIIGPTAFVMLCLWLIQWCITKWSNHHK